MKNRWTVLRRSLYRWIHSLPNETLLSLVVAGQEAVTALGWTPATSDNRDGLIGRIPRRPLPTATFNLSSSLRLAHQVCYYLLLLFIYYHYYPYDKS